MLRYIPSLQWISSYQREWLSADVVAGLTAAAVVIPKAMAYATIAGLPVEVGIYTTFIPLVIYAVLGTSRPLSTSTTTTIAILVGAELAVVAPGGDSATLLTASATLAVMVGVFLALASVLRFGFIANYISQPILIGFKAGIGLVIVVDQLPKLLGVHFEKGNFHENVISIVQALPETSIPTLLMGVAMLVILLGFERFLPKAPAPLIAVAAGIIAMMWFGLSDRGIETVGTIPTGLPSPVMPDLGLLAQLWPAALGIALMSFTESTASARAFAESGEPRPDANQELLATGLANVGGGLFGAMAAGGGTTQTAVNRLAGARTQLAQVVTAACAVLTMLFLAPFISRMPQATLAAVVIVYSIGLIKPQEFGAIRKIRRMEFLWAVAALAGVVLVGTLQGIVIAIVLSMLSLIQQISSPPLHVLGRKPGTDVFRPRSDEHPEDETFPGLLLLQPEGRIFFANAQNYSEKILETLEEEQPRVIVLDLSRVFDLEYTALKMLVEGEERHRKAGRVLCLTGLNPATFDIVTKSVLGPILGRQRMLFNVQDAVRHYQQGDFDQFAAETPASPSR
jgi:high affinity sulfate transporter 1